MSEYLCGLLLAYLVVNTILFFIYATDGYELRFNVLYKAVGGGIPAVLLIVSLGFWLVIFVINELIVIIKGTVIAINERLHRTENNDIEVNEWLNNFIKEN